MKRMQSAHSVPIGGGERRSYDLLIVACGYETRARHIAEWAVGSGGRRIAFAFQEKLEDMSRQENERFFKDLGFDLRPVEQSDGPAIYEEVAAALNVLSENRSSLKVGIDISMSRAWIAGIVRAIRDSEVEAVVTSDFYYVPGSYSEVMEPYPPNRFVGPLAGFRGLALPDRPTVLVLGMGQDPGRAVGLIGYLEPQKLLLMLPVPRAEAQGMTRMLSRTAKKSPECFRDSS
ncbi:MAG: hypothetical protein IPM80_23475 [Proteobacteria bacterium]|nr:hypothetical protein [Pseudomonadota bacterium]